MGAEPQNDTRLIEELGEKSPEALKRGGQTPQHEGETKTTFLPNGVGKLCMFNRKNDRFWWKWNSLTKVRKKEEKRCWGS